MIKPIDLILACMISGVFGSIAALEVIERRDEKTPPPLETVESEFQTCGAFDVMQYRDGRTIIEFERR